jgi:outer membrane protein assembly factor BamA
MTLPSPRYLEHQPQYFAPTPVLPMNKELAEQATWNAPTPTGTAIGPDRPIRVGRIVVTGNTRTRQDVILSQVPFYPGQVLNAADLVTAEKNLARLGIFKSTPDGVHPTVTIVDPDMDGEFKDILITVEEEATGSLLFGLGVNSDCGLTGSIVINERNFDISRFPTSLEDLLSGNAFRGAGQELRIEAMPGTLVPRFAIHFSQPNGSGVRVGGSVIGPAPIELGGFPIRPDVDPQVFSFWQSFFR